MQKWANVAFKYEFQMLLKFCKRLSREGGLNDVFIQGFYYHLSPCFLPPVAFLNVMCLFIAHICNNLG